MMEASLRSMLCSLDALVFGQFMKCEIDRWVGKLLKTKNMMDKGDFSTVDDLNRIDGGDFDTVQLLKSNPHEKDNVAAYFLSRFPGGFQINYTSASTNGQFRICIHSDETYFEITGEPNRGNGIVIRGQIQSRIDPLPPIPPVIIAELRRWFGNLYHVKTDQELLLAIDTCACAFLARRFFPRLKEQFAAAVLEASGYNDLEIVEFDDYGTFSFLMYRPGCRMKIHSVSDASHREYRIFVTLVTKFKITRFIP